MQEQTNLWIREVQSLTSLDRENVLIYSLLEEVNYWKRMEENLTYLEKELKRTDIGKHKNALVSIFIYYL
jgi:hypothetical protein